MTGFLTRLAPIALSLLRAVAGLIFLAHGTQKLIGFPPTDRTVEMLSLVWWAGVIELIAGALLVVGYQTRLCAFMASGTMAFAYWLAHAPQSPYPAVNGGDAAILYCFVFLYIFFAGGGPLSVDEIRNARQSRASAEAAAAPKTDEAAA